MASTPPKSGKLIPSSGRQLAAVGASAGNVPAIFLRAESSGKLPRKGHSYGTILVDLERRCVIDVLQTVLQIHSLIG